MKKKQILLAVFLALLLLAMLIGAAAIVLPGGYINEEIIFTIIIVGLGALASLAILAMGREMRITTRAALIATTASAAGFIGAIWYAQIFGYNSGFDWDELLIKLAAISFALAGVLVHRLLVVPLDPRTHWGAIAKRTSTIAAALTGAGFSLFIITEGVLGLDDLMVRLLTLGLLVTIGSCIALGAISIFAPRPGEDEPDAVEAVLPVSLRCPACHTGLDARSNTPGHCHSCNLQIEVRTQELRCACGYLLHQLQGDICPECGSVVEAGERWGGSPG